MGMTRTIAEILSKLPTRHCAVLQWFTSHAGRSVKWPKPLQVEGAETLVASKAKGIYKPAWSAYAVSVRQSIGGPYPDKEPMTSSDGSWVYAYFQENHEASARDQESLSSKLAGETLSLPM